MHRTFGSDRGLPLTAAQADMWFGQQLDPDSPAFNAVEVVEIDGPVDTDLLETALRRTLAEAQCLRTRFVPDGDGGARQFVEPLDDWALPVLDLRAESDPTAAAHTWMRDRLARPADLGRAPTFTFAVLRTARERFLLYLAIHHLTADGWGMSMIIRRIAEVYTALDAGEPVPPNPLGPMTRALDDEAAYHVSEQFVRDREFWAEQLADWATGQESAHDLPRIPRHFVRETGHLDPGATVRLRALARRARTGLPTIAMAALALYVHRLGGRDDVTLDLTLSGRGPASRDVPLMLTNVLPLRLRLDERTATVEDLLRHTAERAKGVLRHQRYPAGYLTRELKVAPHARKSRTFLGDWNLNIMTYDQRLRFGPHPAVLNNLSNGPVTGLGVNVYDRPADGSLRIDFQAGPDLYPAADVAAHLHRFVALLGTLADAEPDRPLDGIDVLTPAERARTLSLAQGPERPVPAVTLPELFQAHARRAPGATALVCGDAELTAGELNARANRLAHLLVARGAAPETYVALALPRTADYVVALLAVLKAGAACVPLEVGHPVDRLRALLADVRPLCVLTTVAEAARLGTGAGTLALDDARTLHDLAGRPETDPVRAPLPHHPAYAAFTSGTSGRPKGVVVEHRQLTHLFFDHERDLIAPAVAGAGRRLRAALTASFSFDTAWEGPLFLAAGQEVHLIEEEVRMDPVTLVGRVRERRIDFLDVTPSYLRQLLAAGLVEGDGHRPWLVMVGGEAIDAALWQRLRDCPGTSFHNYYGPTECTVDAVYCRVDGRHERPVIGRPGHNVRAHVLDRALRPAPPMTPGELYLGGDQVARGYLDMPALTAERFVADPFGPPGSRMYRTGDLARWTHDGVLEYLGRGDDQVKVRGVRIELPEIEAVLARHPRIAHAAVAVHRSGPDSHTLAAHVVPDGPVDIADLRSWTATRLPAAMVPSAFLLHDALPLTAHGKLDRAALPAVTDRPAPSGRPPRTGREQALCALFAQVLDVPEVGVDDDFFTLGGHSLLAAQLVSRIRAELGTGLSLGALYQAPTVAALAALLDEKDQEDAYRPLLPLRTTGSRPPLFCVHPAGGLAWCYAVLPRHLPADLPVYALQARGLRDRDKPAGSFEEAFTDYIRHIRSVQPTGPYHLLGWSLGGALAHAVAVRLQAEGDRVELLAMLDAPPIDPAGERVPVEAEEQIVRILLGEAADGPEPMRAALVKEHLTAAVAAMRHHTTLLPTFTERVFDGDLLYFHATRGKPATATTARTWQPWITGRIVCHDVDCTHHAMAKAENMALVGKVLSERLTRQSPVG
ncbi:amino acid adenylation domain-containing protein [Streptomyces sp. NPDC006610]|uniref:amino acid adenylation domain-containing protein n=1 Tax=Streptomyces sp. NPDC006610 TaxID=3154584 RepID=UPI0033A8C159